MLSMLAILWIVFLLAYIIIKKPKFGGSIALVSIFIIALAVFLFNSEDKRVTKREGRIAVEQIEIKDLNYQWAYGNYYKITALVKNNSPKYRLQSINLSLSFYACPKSVTALVTIPITTSVTTSVKNTQNLSQCQLVVDNKSMNIRTRVDSGQSIQVEGYYLQQNEAVLALSHEKSDKTMRWKIELVNGMAY